MKRKLFFILASAAFLTPMASLAGGPEILLVEPDYFSGFFVGGTGAFHQTVFNGTSSASTASAVEVVPPPILFPPTPIAPNVAVTIDQVFFPGGTLLSNAVNGNSFDGFYGVQGGVGKVFNHRWYVGMVGFGEWGDQSDTEINNANFQTTSNIITTSSGVVFDQASISTTGTYNSSTTTKLSNNYGVAFKPGFLVSPKTMVYGKIGAVWADLEVSNAFSGNSFTQDNDSIRAPVNTTYYTAEATLTGSSSNEQNKVALLLGVGVEQFIYRDFVTLSVEYNYANYGYVSTSTPLNARGSITVNLPTVTPPPIVTPVSLNNVGVAEASSNARVSTLLAGLNFYFGSHWF